MGSKSFIKNNIKIRPTAVFADREGAFGQRGNSYLDKHRIMSSVKVNSNKIKGKLSKSYLKNYGNFKQYKEKVKNFNVVCTEIKTGKLKVFNAISKSRYFSKGLKNNLRKFKNKLNKKGRHPGVFLTLTFAQRGLTYDGVYKRLQGAIRKFLSVAKVYYKRHHYGKSFEYVWVVEFHKSGYPHIHIFFPDLKWLAHWKEIKRWWQFGNIKIKYRNIKKIGSYMSSYISKHEQKNSVVGFFFMWKYGIRSYGFSRMFYEHIEKQEKYKLEFCFYYTFGCELRLIYDESIHAESEILKIITNSDLSP